MTEGLSRRGVLGGLAGLLAVPAIIRTPGLLMPVKQPVVLSSGPITAEMIAREASWMLGSPLGQTPFYGFAPITQSYVNFDTNEKDLALSMEDFSRRILRPVIGALQQHMGQNNAKIVASNLELPKGVVDAAMVNNVRVVVAYCLSMDKVSTQIDVLHTTGKMT